MSDDADLIGSFAQEDGCVRAIEALKRAGIGNDRFRVFAPIPSEHVRHALGRALSPVRVMVLLGGIAGVLTGFAITAGTSLEWSLVVGGKPIISMPPFIIIMFELMILFGGLSGALSFFFFARLPQVEPIAGFSERFSADRFGIAVACRDEDRPRVESLLREAGAEDVVHEAAAGEAGVEGPPP